MNWRVTVFGSAGETSRLFPTEAQANDYARRARIAGCLAKVEKAA